MSVALREVPVHRLLTKSKALTRYKKGGNVLFENCEERNIVCVFN